MIDKVDNAQEALIICITEIGKVDINQRFIERLVYTKKER